MEFSKIVLMPILVPVGDFCHGKTEGDEHTRICEYLNSEGGHIDCCLGFTPIGRDSQGRNPKPFECLNLKEVTE